MNNMVEHEFGVPIPGTILSESEWARTAIKRLPPSEEGPLDWSAIFGRDAPLILDLGCGNGRFTLQSALNRPECDHVAVDLLPAVVRYATKRANQRGLWNVRVVVKDAQTFLSAYVLPGSAAEIHVYHPQPDPDPKRPRLQLVTPAFLRSAHRALEPGGQIVLQSDNPPYWSYIRSILTSFFDVRDHPEPWPDAPEGRTRREILARSKALTIFRAIGRRRDELDETELDSLVESLPLFDATESGPWTELDALESPTKHQRPGARSRGRRRSSRRS